jgi:elongation factor G
MAAKAFASSNIRNIALVGHGGSGKTSMADAMLYVSGTMGRLGKVTDHTSVFDFEPEEHKRGGSISTSLAWMAHDGHKINVLDTPGDQNFIFDAINALQGADAAVVFISAPDGVEVQTERVYQAARSAGKPVVLVINKMNRDRAIAETVLQDIEDSFGTQAVPLQIPIGSEGGFKGFVSLFQMRALTFEGDNGKASVGDIPADLQDEVASAWENVVESVASTDDELLEQYLETFELSQDQVKTAFRTALKKGEILPVIYGAADKGIGAAALLDLITWACPSPVEATLRCDEAGNLKDCDASAPFAAQVIHTHVDESSGKVSVFRVFSGSVPADNVVLNTHANESERLGTLFALRGKEREPVAKAVPGDILGVAKLKYTHTGDTLCDPDARCTFEPVQYPPPMMSYVILPEGKGDEDKLRTGLDRLLEEDPTLTVTHDELTKQLVLNGMGQAHLDMAIERMRRKYKVNASTSLVPVPYRETLRKPASHVEGKHKKQTGGAGQFGVCYINVMPQPKDAGFEFVNKIKGGAIPNQFIPSVEKGIKSRMESGFMGGYPIVDIKIELVDGKYHPVDSKDLAFQLAGSKGLKSAFEQGGTVLLEPMMDMQIVVPTDNMGDIMGDITSRRGRVSGMDPKGKNTVIMACAPLAEIQRYAPDLKSMTGGKGSFTMSLSGYEEVPPNLIAGVVSRSPFKKDRDEV